MNTPLSSSLPRPLRTLAAVALTLAALAAGAASASAYVSPAAAEHAAGRGASWFESNQQASGDLGSDWAMTALAAVDLNAADVRTTLADPSAQDFYLDEWQVGGPGGAATDAARGILAGESGGIQTSRLSTETDATRSNLVARLAELFDGTQIGSPALLNDDIFGVLALQRAGAPEVLLRRLVDGLRASQLADGGWSWNASPGATADVDMTGSAIAAFCAAGVSPADPDMQEALALLHSAQDQATGGFSAPPPFGIGPNADTTAWVSSGLVQCGIDPQGPEWTTSAGKTPFDYLLSLQRPDGHFDWTSEYGGGAFETYSAVRPLAGVAFSTAAPPRLDGSSPAVRPAPAVADGTTVPVTLVIDHGPGSGDVRMCRVDVADGAGLAEFLGAAETASSPAGCVADSTTVARAGGAAVAALDGVAETAEYGWEVKVDGGPAAAATGEPIGFGDLVFLRFAAKVADPGPAPKVEVPPLRPASAPEPAPRPRVALDGPARWGKQGVRQALRCPRGLGAAGCRGVVSVRFRAHRGGKLQGGGSAAYAVESGTRRVVTIAPSRALRKRIARGGRLQLRLTAATRSEDGGIALTRAKRFLAG